jgi:UDP-2,3-diacylglucosamine hydrolase
MKQIFISDLHLDADRPDLTDAFIKFLDSHCQDTDELYILGDFFEVWLGDDDIDDCNTLVSAALKSLSATVYLMHGNRDFLIGEAFCEQAGATLLADPTLLQLSIGPALLMHGDSLCTRDEKYMLARQQLRAPAFQADFLARPIGERVEIAKQIRGESQTLKRETAADIMDVTEAEVIREMEAANVAILIHGHTHRPAVHDVALASTSGTRYVLGDWQTSTSYLEVENGVIELKQFVFS